MYRILISKNKDEEVYAVSLTENKDEIYCFNLQCDDDTFDCRDCIYYSDDDNDYDDIKSFSFSELAQDDRIALGATTYRNPYKKLKHMLKQKKELLDEIYEQDEKIIDFLFDTVKYLTPEELQEIQEMFKTLDVLK